ncbi:MAG: DUF4388 domain-containing protein [Actinomycetota bacterium]|nr:DUF4388 domain-containing protein [Actinomycetota bacterium]
MFTGTLDDFTLPEIFRLLSQSGRTGRLDVTRSAGHGAVFFRDGDVYYAQSSLSTERLGRHLLRARAITEGQLRRALDEHAASNRRIGDILRDHGALSEEHLHAAIRSQIEDAAFDLLRWESGEFSWVGGVTTEVEVPIAVSVENLIMEAARRIDELEVIRRRIPSGDSVLAMSPTPPEGALEINIAPDEWRVLVTVDGTRSVDEIAAALRYDEFELLKILYGLISAGLVELATRGAEPGDSESGGAVVSLERRSANGTRPSHPSSNGSAGPAPVIAEPRFDTPETRPQPMYEVATPAPDELEPPRDDVVPEAPTVTFTPARGDGAPPPPVLDRSAAARELNDIFSDGQDGQPPAKPRRVEDDSGIDKSLVNRLIDGVKGL